MQEVENDAATPQLVPSAYERCPLPAKFYIKRPQGYANICRVHYEEIASQEAAAWGRARRINNARAYLLETLGKIGNQPGGLAWAQPIMARAAAGENLPLISVQLALAMQQPREPGEDEGETEVSA